MKILRVVALLPLMMACAGAWGQSAEDQRVTLVHLSINDPMLTGTPLLVTAQDGYVLWNYKTLRAEENPLPSSIFVRVFHGSKEALIREMPKYIKQGCVDYSPARFEVSTAGYRLRFWGLDDKWLASGTPEVLTLVFEAGDQGGSSSLRLAADKTSIANYFHSGIEIKLMPPAGYRRAAQGGGSATGGVVVSTSTAGQVVRNPAPPVVLPPCHVIEDYRVKKAGVAAGGVMVAREMVMKEVPCGT